MRGIEGPRAARARGPARDLDEMVRAYLDLLKLCLCDLAGARTLTAKGVAGGGLETSELAPEQLALRVEGRDWPVHGLTMCGLVRLDDLQACVESIVADGIGGDLIELGTWRGGASILMRATLDCLGVSDRTVWLADSFQGFPPHSPGTTRAFPQTVEPYLAAFDFLAAPLEEVKANLARFGLEDGIRFLPGFFEATLPQLPRRSWSLIRLDADTYDPTLLALQTLYPDLSAGGYAVVDDYGALEECRAAVDDYRAAHGITEPLEVVDWGCVRWRKRPTEGR